MVVLAEHSDSKKEVETFIRKDLSGVLIGGLVLEPKDIEIVDDISDYFKSRGIFYYKYLSDIQQRGYKGEKFLKHSTIIFFGFVLLTETGGENEHQKYLFGVRIWRSFGNPKI